MDRIDILTPELSQCASFTVNTAVNFVPLTPTVLGDPILYSGNDEYKFTKGDNITILSAGYFLPERFVIYGHDNAAAAKNCVPWLFLYSIGSAGAGSVVWQFGSNGRLNCPFPNYEFSLGTFVDSIELGMIDPFYWLTLRFPFQSDADNLNISMVDVPAAMNGVKFYVVPFIKVLHTLPMTH